MNLTHIFLVIFAILVTALFLSFMVIPRALLKAEQKKRKLWDTEDLNDIQRDMNDIIRRLYARADRAELVIETSRQEVADLEQAQLIQEGIASSRTNVFKKATETAKALEKLFPEEHHGSYHSE